MNPLTLSSLLLLLASNSLVIQDRDAQRKTGSSKTIERHVAQPLWPGDAPSALGQETKDRPTLTAFPANPESNTHIGVIICPGGGYGHLALDHEGRAIGRWLSDNGISGFLCDYRHRGKGYGHPAPLQDVQRAVRTVRYDAKKWDLDPGRIGVLGFSAGGHLASSAATQFDKGNANAPDLIDRVSSRPDFAILCYPVIAMGQSFSHRGSQKNLLGKNPSPQLVARMSTELQVTAETPPTFLWHTSEDKAVPAENSIVFYQALRAAGVPAELHVYARGRHGIGLAVGKPGAEDWPAACLHWLKDVSKSK